MELFGKMWIKDILERRKGYIDYLFPDYSDNDKFIVPLDRNSFPRAVLGDNNLAIVLIDSK